jgi:hypothetical protein
MSDIPLPFDCLPKALQTPTRGDIRDDADVIAVGY